MGEVCWFSVVLMFEETVIHTVVSLRWSQKGTRKWQLKERGESRRGGDIFVPLQSASAQKEMEKRQQSVPVWMSAGAEERERVMGAGRAGEGGSVRGSSGEGYEHGNTRCT